jgi:hypothetical protein
VPDTSHGAAYYGIRRLPSLRHCNNCGVEWAREERRCWYCGRFGPKGGMRPYWSNSQEMTFGPNNTKEDPCP